LRLINLKRKIMTDIEDKNMQRIVRGGDTADSQPLIWDSDENMVALRLRITNMVASQRANNLIQTTSIHGNVDTKLVNGMLMGTAGFMLGQTCMEFAIGAGNLVLEGEMKISQEELIKSGSASVIKARNQLVNDRCTSNLAAMITAGFQITAGKIATHLGYIGNYNTSIPSWKDADVIKKEATANIKIGNSTTVNSIIPSAKRLLLPYKVSNSVWYGTMINALKPLTTGTRLEAIIIKFEDATTETAIKGVVLHINENNKNYISTKLGYSRAKSLGTGNYSATWSHPLYGSGRIPVMGYTTGGKPFRLTLMLNKTPLLGADEPVIPPAEVKKRKSKSKGTALKASVKIAVDKKVVAKEVKEKKK
jgi:hypothetical protein